MLKKIQRPKSAYERYFKEADDTEDRVSVIVAPRKNRGTDYESIYETDNITVAPRKNRGTEYSAEDEEETVEEPDMRDDESSYEDEPEAGDMADDIDAEESGPDTGDDSSYEDDTETGAEDPEDEEGEEAGPDTGDEDTDYSADDGGEEVPAEGESEEGSDEGETTEADSEEKRKKYHMYKRFLHLYNVIDSFIEKLRSVVSDNSIDNVVTKTVADNLTDVHSALYDYMVIKYKKESYVQILIYFETVISIIRLNFELLRNNHINLKQ